MGPSGTARPVSLEPLLPAPAVVGSSGSFERFFLVGQLHDDVAQDRGQLVVGMVCMHPRMPNGVTYPGGNADKLCPPPFGDLVDVRLAAAGLQLADACRRDAFAVRQVGVGSGPAAPRGGRGKVAPCGLLLTSGHGSM